MLIFYLLINHFFTRKKKTKHVFKELRDLQKSFEDIFNIPKIHNYLKMSLLCSTNNDDKFEIINYYMQIKNEDVVDDQYAKWRLVGATHRQIVKSSELKDGEETKEDKARTACENLSLKFITLKFRRQCRLFLF